ncbi:MAG: hypothetical protein IIA09_17350 [Proteobacteria bacterium]|nr:hypothetical protein [Pseudomonadota bacterium]
MERIGISGAYVATLKKIAAVVLAVVAGFILLSLGSHFYVVFQKAGAQRQLQESYARDNFTPEEIRQDIAYFRFLLEHVHPRENSSFPLGRAQPALTELAETLDQPITSLAFYQEIAPVGNLLNDEHTMVFPAEPDLPGIYEPGVRLFPLDVKFIDHKLYVARNLSGESSIQPGMEIISINELPAQELRTTMMTYYSGAGDAQKEFYAEKKFREALTLIFGFGDSFDLVVDDPVLDETNSYVIAGKKVSRPGLETFRYKVIAPDTILLTYNAFEDENDEFTNFLQEMFATAQQQNIQHLIIDIRGNQGGASTYGDDILAYLIAEPFTQFSHVDVTISEEVKRDFIGHVPAFIRWFPIQYFHPILKPLWMGESRETATITFDPVAPGDNSLRFAGDVTLLIGPGTMSSASLFAATMRKYNIATLIGEEAGGSATPYGNIIDAYLPNTGLKVWMPTSVIYGNSTGPIVPDHVVTQTVADLSEQRDSVLEFSQELARSIHADQLGQ